MAVNFIVEDGTCKADATSYLTLAECNQYHEDRGHTAWSGTDPLKQVCLIRATDYINKRFGRKFRGIRQTQEQTMEWPRLSAYDDSGWRLKDVPLALRQACAEYALRALLNGELSPDPSLPVPGQSFDDDITAPEGSASGGALTVVREKVGPIEEERRYEKGELTTAPKSNVVSAWNIPEYPAADMLLEPLLMSVSSKTLARG